MEEKLGYQETKEAVSLVLALGMAVDKSLADDGRISLKDALNLIEPAKKVPAAVKDISKVPAELADMDETEKASLISELKAEFDLRDDKAEAIIEEALGLSVSLGSLILKLKGAKAS